MSRRASGRAAAFALIVSGALLAGNGPLRRRPRP
jgi:hypothetical protein